MPFVGGVWEGFDDGFLFAYALPLTAPAKKELCPMIWN
jgi:hypothetical protein